LKSDGLKMNLEKHISIGGIVTDIFAHRVVVENDMGKWLADLGPASTEMIALTKGMHISLTGEMKPSELKADTISIGGGPVLLLRAPKGDEACRERADSDAALSSAQARGLAVIGLPRRKPKHFEILARDSGGDFLELHIEFDGSIRKTTPVDRAAPKWADEVERQQA
jgi:hypothetical protein